MTDSNWNLALDDAIRAESHNSPGINIFLEEREDLTAELRTGSDRSVIHTFWRGGAARASSPASRLSYLADPAPEDAARLVRSVVDERLRFPERGAGDVTTGGPESRMAPAESQSVVEELAARIELERPGVEMLARYVAFDQRVRIARSEAPRAEDRRRGARLRVEARLVARGLESRAVIEAARLGGEPTDRPRRLGELVRSLVRRLDERLDARPAPTGERAVVFGPGVGGILIHEVVGHPLEADAVLRGESWLAVFKESLPKDLTVLDDPRRSRAPWHIDDEGEESMPTPLIRDGRVTGWLLDRSTAERSGRRPTGHGRCASFRETVRPRMGCTFVAPGRREPDEIVGQVADGIYVRRMEAAHTDTATGRTTFRVTDADRILNGRIDCALQPFLLYIDGPTVIQNLRDVANDLDFDTCIGACHKDGQPLAVSVGAPTMSIGVTMVGA